MSESAKPLLELRGTGKRFPGVIALDDVDFSIGAGEVVALLGENGAGKSTLMKIIGGIYQPDAGEILLDGSVVKFGGVNDSIAGGIAFIHQKLNMLENLDVAANVFLGREPVRGGFLKLLDRRKIVADAAIYLKRIGLDIPPTTPVAELSIGQCQMVEIAKALSLNARLIIMDEPTSSLTTTETTRLLELVRELRDQGVSVVYITHRLGEVSEICDRAIVLRDGKNAGELDREHLTHENMVQLMVGRALKHSYVEPETKREDVVLELKDVATRRFPAQKVSFAVRAGEIFGIAGLVGAGRSDLAQTIFGVERRSGGEIYVNGAALRGTSSEAIRRGVYLIPEDRRNTGLLTDFAVRENITLPALGRYLKAGMINRSRERDASEKLCARLNVKTASVETAAKNLSGGNQQKVVLAKWLQLDPKVLIFDEPTRGIDVGAKAEIYTLIRDLAKNGVAVIVISSDMEEILGISDRLAVMNEGRVTGILERGDCSEKNVMTLAVGGAV